MNSKYIITSMVGMVAFAAITTTTYAAYATFEPKSFSGSVGSTIAVPVVIDTEGTETRAADLYVDYDASSLEPVNIEKGTLYRNVINQTQTGRVYLAVYEDNPTLNVKGRGVVATINFKIKAEKASEISFFCDKTKAATSKIVDATANNFSIVECEKYGKATVSISTTSVKPTATPTTTTTSTTVAAKVTPTQLPKSGATENVLLAVAFGAIFSALGMGLKFMRL